jgi:hypothetical protein
MQLARAVIVHGAHDAGLARAPGRPVTLLSAPGAALYAGCLWWLGIAGPDGILDCADAPGLALGALRSGVTRLVLWPDAPGWHAVAEIAARQGGFVLPQAPPALDLAEPGAIRRLPAWLA